MSKQTIHHQWLFVNKRSVSWSVDGHCPKSVIYVPRLGVFGKFNQVFSNPRTIILVFVRYIKVFLTQTANFKLHFQKPKTTLS